MGKVCTVGGQAVMEGVMMKSPTGIAMAVRKPDGTIATQYKPENRARRRARSMGCRLCAAWLRLWNRSPSAWVR